MNFAAALKPALHALRVAGSWPMSRSTCPPRLFWSSAVLDCANHCIICCSDLRSNSSLLVHSSRSCAQGCELCAIECAKHKTALTNRCEAACRVCADECLSLAAALAKREARRALPRKTIAILTRAHRVSNRRSDRYFYYPFLMGIEARRRKRPFPANSSSREWPTGC